jgi:hypothetical protein
MCTVISDQMTNPISKTKFDAAGIWYCFNKRKIPFDDPITFLQQQDPTFCVGFLACKAMQIIVQVHVFYFFSINLLISLFRIILSRKGWKYCYEKVMVFSMIFIII